MVIIIMGAAGAGKTTTGRALAAEARWTFVDADDHHPARSIEKMRAGTPLNEADRALWIARLQAIVERAIERREHLVLACSALKERYRHALRGSLHPVRFVYLKADRERLEKRLAERPGHFFPPQLVVTQLAELEEPAGDLVVDASDPPVRIVAAIRREFGV